MSLRTRQTLLGERLDAEDPENEVSAHVNISPLVDMVFLLLIFFMVTSVFTRNRAVEVALPQAQSATAADDGAILLTLTAEGELFLGEETISLDRLRTLMAGILHDTGERPVLLMADEAAPTGLAVRILDQCRLAGAKRAALAAK